MKKELNDQIKQKQQIVTSDEALDPLNLKDTLVRIKALVDAPYFRAEVLSRQTRIRALTEHALKILETVERKVNL